MRDPVGMFRLWVLVPLLFAVGVGAYGLGLLGAAVSEMDEACSQGLVHGGADLRQIRESFFPLQQTCVFSDGTTHEVIPAWVNPLFLGGIAGSFGCAATLILAGCRD